MRREPAPEGVAAPSPAAATVASAARTTLAASSARVCRRRFVDPPPPEDRDFGDVEEGVTDFALRRTAVTQSQGMGLRALNERLSDLFPWLDDEDEEAGDGASDGSRLVYAGTSCFFLFPARCAVIADGRVDATNRVHTDPTWIVEVLQHVETAQAGGEGDIVRGTACRRYAFNADLASLEGIVEMPPHTGRRRPRLLGEAWIDDANLIRRVTWTRVDARRPRARRRPADPNRYWQTTELWDYGTPADIELPQAERDASWWNRVPWPATFAHLAWTLWRRKRTYQRRALRRLRPHCCFLKHHSRARR